MALVQGFVLQGLVCYTERTPSETVDIRIWCTGSTGASKTPRIGFDSLGACWLYGASTKGSKMVALGIILLVLGLVFGLGGQTLLYVGGALIIIGLVFNFVPFGGSNHRVW